MLQLQRTECLLPVFSVLLRRIVFFPGFLLCTLSIPYFPEDLLCGPNLLFHRCLFSMRRIKLRFCAVHCFLRRFYISLQVRDFSPEIFCRLFLFLKALHGLRERLVNRLYVICRRQALNQLLLFRICPRKRGKFACSLLSLFRFREMIRKCLSLRHRFLRGIAEERCFPLLLRQASGFFL